MKACELRCFGRKNWSLPAMALATALLFASTLTAQNRSHESRSGSIRQRYTWSATTLTGDLLYSSGRFSYEQ
jgi:heme/copper-type cytochrome/quinol oxidase subunit 3